MSRSCSINVTILERNIAFVAEVVAQFIYGVQVSAVPTFV